MRRIDVPDLLLDKAVLLAAGGTFSQPFLRLLAAVLAEKHRPRFFHESPFLTHSKLFRVHTFSHRLRQLKRLE